MASPFTALTLDDTFGVLLIATFVSLACVSFHDRPPITSISGSRLCTRLVYTSPAAYMVSPFISRIGTSVRVSGIHWR